MSLLIVFTIDHPMPYIDRILIALSPFTQAFVNFKFLGKFHHHMVLRYSSYKNYNFSAFSFTLGGKWAIDN